MENILDPFLQQQGCTGMKLNFMKTIRYTGLLLFIIILANLNIDNTMNILLNMNISYFLISSILFIPYVIIKSTRWKLLMSALDIKYSLKDSTVMYMAATFIGSITPGYIGDFIKILYLKKDEHPFGRSFSSILLDRLFDIASIILLGLAGSLLIYQVYQVHATSFSAIFILMAIVLLTIITAPKWRNYAKTIVIYVSNKVLPYKYKENVGNYFDDVFNSFSLFSFIDISIAILLTILGWAINFFMAYLVALSIHLTISFMYLATCMAISTLIAFIPISISGIGTRDATLIILFSYIGYSMESAIAFSTARFMLYLVNITVTMVAWMVRPIEIERYQRAV